MRELLFFIVGQRIDQPGRTLYKVGVSFSSETRKVAEWVKV